MKIHVISSRKFCYFKINHYFCNYKLIPKMEDYARTERISQESDGGEKSLCDLLHKASDVARATLNSMQEIAGTTSCKGVQIASLEKWAHKESYWIDSPDILGTYSDRGSENEVYVSTDMQYIFKLNDFRYSDDNLTPFFDRMEAHNHYFEDCKYLSGNNILHEL
ncbi:MAG: hypothetical protein MJZ12_01885 [Prevotella sp.]|nr:hypothetical protein [Prevotella sp.]